jgi:anti-anti-sigma factor
MDGTLEIEHAPGVDVFVLRGEHDLSSQAALQGRIDQALNAGRSVVVDLSAVDFIDSTVLASILHGQRRAAAMDGHVRGLSLVRIEDHIPVRLSRDSAVVSLQRNGSPG